MTSGEQLRSWVDRRAVAIERSKLTQIFGELPPGLADELRSQAASCEIPPESLLALDAGVVEAQGVRARVESSLSLYIHGERGPVIGGAWVLGDAEASECMPRRVPEGWVIGLPGSLGLVGIARAGHVIQGNLMRPATPGAGLPGSAAMRLALAEPNLASARARIERTALIDGRAWLLADGSSLFGIEQLGARSALTRVSPRTGHVHTNHCFDPALRQIEFLPRNPESFRRMEVATTLYVQQRPTSAAELLGFLVEVERESFPAAPALRANVCWAIEIIGAKVLLRRADGPVEIIDLRESP